MGLCCTQSEPEAKQPEALFLVHALALPGSVRFAVQALQGPCGPRCRYRLRFSAGAQVP